MTPNLGDLMKQAQQLQTQMQQAQEKLASAEVTGEAGAGMIKVVMTGRHDVRRVLIDPALMSEEKDVLEDLLAAAVNDAVRRVEANTREMMSSMTQGMNLPDGFKMPL